MSIKVQQNTPLAPYATFKIGGPARHLVEVSDEEEFIEALNYAKENNLETFVLGGGSNILVSDKGFDGLVIKLSKGSKSPIGLLEPTHVECWAGESLASVVNFCSENSLTGIEWAAGIPGTIGGAVRGNAGAFGSCVENNIEEVRIFDINKNVTSNDETQNSKLKTQNCKLKVERFNIVNCQFSYRNSIFKQNSNLIILSCVLKLKEGNKEEIKNKMEEIIKTRVEKQPSGFSAGSFFENPVVNEKIVEQFERSTGAKCKDNKVPAGWLIYETGLKGKRIGEVQVSEKHANFVVNNGSGRAEDVIILASIIKQKVRRQFGVQLREEVKYVGF